MWRWGNFSATFRNEYFEEHARLASGLPSPHVLRTPPVPPVSSTPSTFPRPPASKSSAGPENPLLRLSEVAQLHQLFVSNLPVDTTLVEMRDFFGSLCEGAFFLAPCFFSGGGGADVSGAGLVDAALGPVSQRFRNRAGWIVFGSLGEREEARKMLLGRVFARQLAPLYLRDEGERGKSKRDWRWRECSPLLAFARYDVC